LYTTPFGFSNEIPAEVRTQVSANELAIEKPLPIDEMNPQFKECEIRTSKKNK